MVLGLEWRFAMNFMSGLFYVWVMWTIYMKLFHPTWRCPFKPKMLLWILWCGLGGIDMKLIYPNQRCQFQSGADKVKEASIMDFTCGFCRTGTKLA
jgi:hypothetical protein